MSRAGILQRNNTSGVPGIRLRMHRGRYGAPRPEIAVRYRKSPRARRWLHTSLPATIDGMRRALQLREASIGKPVGVGPRTALALAKGAAACA